MNLTIEDKFILSSLKLKPTEADINRLNDLIPLIHDWDTLLKIAIERGIGPLMYKNQLQLNNSHLIPNDIKETLQQSYYMTLRRSMVLHDGLTKILDVFYKNDISVIALKGIFLSEWLYGDIGLRQFSDIDLLIKPEDGLKGISILSEMGFASK